MARMVQCQKYGKQMEGLDAPPFPGPKGLEAFENISKQAWSDWIAHQTTLINEKHLNMMDKEHRNYLNQQRDLFLKGEQYDSAEGYVPPEQDKSE